MSLALREQGVVAGDRVGVSLASSPMALMILMALAQLGACAVPLSVGRSAASRTEIARKYGVKQLVVDAEQLKLPEWPAIHVLSMAISDHDLRSTQSLLQDTSAHLHAELADQAWFVVLSSGSTGVPKGVALTQAQAWARIRQSTLDWNENTRVLPYELAIGAGLFPALRTLAAGGTVVITEELDFSDGFAKFVNLHRATHVMSSPWMAEKLLQQLVSCDAYLALPTVQYLWIAGGHCSRAVLQGLLERATPNVWMKYACAETGVVASAPAQDVLHAAGLSGQIGGWIESGVVDEQGQSLPTGQTGLLRFRGPDWPTRYADEHDNADTAFADGWYQSKDYGRIDEQGQLYVQGRAEGLINIAGMRIEAEYFEEHLTAALGLKECALFAVLESDGTSRLAVAISQADAHHSSAIKPLLAQHFVNIADARVQVVVLPELARTPMGKIARRQLQQEFSVFL